MLNKGETILPYKPYTKNTIEIPEVVQAIDGYGRGVNEQYHNKIVWNPAEGVKKFIKNIGSVDLGALEWRYVVKDNAQYFSTTVNGKAPLNIMFCDRYKVHYVALEDMDNMTMRGASGNATVYIKDNAYLDAESFKTAMQGVMLLYQLEIPIETDISDYLGDDNFIGVESGGTVTAVNEHEYDVPFEVEYMVKGGGTGE